MQQDEKNLDVEGSGTIGDPWRPKGIETGTQVLPMPRVKGLAAVRDVMLDKVKPLTTHDVIAQRGPTHGDWDDNALLSQQLKDTIRSFQRKDGSYPWHELTPAMKEALDMDCLKTSRAVTGRADFRDHWADKAGYATLVADRCPD